LDLEPEIVRRIKRYKRGNLVNRLFVLTPLLLEDVAFITLIIVGGATGNGDLVRMSTGGARGPFWVWLLFLFVTLLVFSLLLFTWSDKLYFARADDAEAVKRFRDAIDGLSVAAGVPAPRLVVLDAPTVNSVALRSGKVSSIGVTASTLEAGLSRQEAEAMMAHEISHVLIGDGFARATARYRAKTGLILFALLVLPFVLASLVFGFYWWITLALLVWTIAVIFWAVPASRGFFSNDDTLADSIAARLTYDPVTLIKTIEKLDDLYTSGPAPFPPGAIYPDHMFINRTRVGTRIENLKAIERGFSAGAGPPG
jgi:Zn-dependent protease with chaperone function